MEKQVAARIGKIAAGKGSICIAIKVHGRFVMKQRPETLVRRRDLLRTMMTGVAAVATAQTIALEPAAGKTWTRADKRKARYQASSTEVQEFYRVNRYPAP